MKKILGLLGLSFVLTALLAVMLLPADAQDGPPDVPMVEEPFKYDEPAYVEGGDAEWTVSDSVFTSNYPDGFTFEAQAASTGGELVSVSIFYSHNPAWEDDHRMRGEVDPSTGTVRVSVAGTDAENIPPWVEINYRWRISDSAGTVFWSDWFTGFEYADNTRKWQRFESEDVLIFIPQGFPQQAVDYAFDAMDEARPLYESAFGRRLSYKPRMILFNNLEHFREWRGFEFGAGGTIVVGQASPNWGMFVQVLTDTIDAEMREFAYGVVVHEIAHLYQYDLYEFRGPGWWIEGNATFFEFTNFYDYEQRVRNWAAQDRLPRIFVDGGPGSNSAGPDGIGRWGYDVGYTFNRWMIDRYGFEAHRELIALLAEPENLSSFEADDFFNEALEQVLGMPIEEIEAEWRLWLGASGAAPTLIPTPTIEYRFPATTTPFGQ